MATLETQYKNYKSKHPQSNVSFEEWKTIAFGSLQIEPQVEVEIIESERGWGSKVDEVKKFYTKEEALAFIEDYNSVNDEPVTPDWYMYARLK